MVILERMLNQRRELKAEINHLHPSMIDRMPVEVAANIFEFYVGDRSFEVRFGRPPLALQLGAVCQTWRRIAWSTPQVWAFISMDLSVRPERISERAVQRYMTLEQLLSDWIARSGCSPLSIELYSRHCLDDRQAEWILPIIRIVNSLSTRWKYLELRLPMSVLPRFFVNTGQFNTASLLEEIQIWNTTAIFDLTAASVSLRGTGPGGGGRVKPAPKKVDLGAVRVKSLDIEWNKVTSLSISILCMDEVFHVLRHSPSLVDCSITRLSYLSENGHLGYIPDRNLPFVHHKLKQLLIKFHDPEPSSEFFSRVTLPYLEALSCDFKDYTLPTDIFVSFLRRSGLPAEKSVSAGSMISNPGMHGPNTNLKALSLIHPGFPEDPAALISICNAVPALKELSLMPATNDEDTSFDLFYGALANDTASISDEVRQVAPGNTVDSTSLEDSNLNDPEALMLLPALETLTCTTHNEDFPWEVIPRFFLPFNGRNPSCCRPLRTLKVCYMTDTPEPLPFIDTKTLALLHDLIDQNVDLSVLNAHLAGETDMIHYPGSGLR
ncbi:hypothetical protein GALMADRAFT_132571 [Galerina marginata CBS 339.88]|uniref:Uncharacterized protein n=1 Tax=Galerina marginata (strain CBS 339.88) TaxID=685588 RepID=A0A067U121_GALM3|nr:hypothetical protein GALMADRAFT_132571 [Galerina marginata CBS 339.88]